ncbi:hypothetical protein KEM52_002291 [Ascosphaera acerosa]|nr:hypothetical protein KEM52_002291 [Ascosphaera acerosa]
MAREHGIGLLCSAIRRGLLTLAMFDYLCGATALNGHCDALEAVQRAWRQSISHPLQWPTPPMHKGSAPRCSPPALRPLFTYARLGSTLRELTAFIDDGQLPVEWAASSALRTVVAEALSSLAKRDRTTHAAAAFIASILRRAVAPSDPPYKPVQSQSREAQATALRAKSARHMTTAPSPADETAEAFSNTVASLLVILCSLHVRSAGHSAATQSVAFHVIASVIYDCMLTRSDTPTCSSKQNQVRRSYVFLAFLVFMTQGLDRLACLQRFEAVCQSFTDKSLVVRCLSSFAINLSCSHQADPESGFPRLQTIVRTLLCVDGSSYPTAHALLGKAAVEVTADYAQLTFSPDHHEFAVSVQREVEARRYACTIELTPSLALKGYRWDDGFGEWVMVTAARGRGRDVKCRGRRHERGRALRTTSEIERSSHCDDMDTLRCESPVILDSQQTDSSESSQGSAVFSTGPSDAGSSVESDSPSPSLRKRPLVLVDESDGEPQPLNRHTRRRRLDIVDSEGEETEPESQGDCESPLRGHQLSHAVRSLRGRRSRNDDRHVDPPRDGDGGYLIRSRPRRPGVRVQIYQDQRSGRRSLSPAKAASEGDETSNPRRHGRHVLRERRSGGNIAPSPAAAQHLHKSGKDSQVKVPRFAVVIDNTRRSTASSLHGASERASRPAHRVAAVAKHVPRQVPPALDDDGAISEDELSHDIPPPMPPGLARRRSRSRRHSPLVHAAHFAARSSVSSPAHVVLDSQTSTDSDDELSFLV